MHSAETENWVGFTAVETVNWPSAGCVWISRSAGRRSPAPQPRASPGARAPPLPAGPAVNPGTHGTFVQQMRTGAHLGPRPRGLQM